MEKLALNKRGELQTRPTKVCRDGCEYIKQKGQLEVYNSGGTLKESTGGTYMTKEKTTTAEERLQIVKDCLVNDNNYGAMAII